MSVSAWRTISISKKGKLAESNAQLLQKVVDIATILGRPVATPAQAREMMGLPQEPRQYK